MATNITIRVSSGLAREARILAARRGTSLSRLVADQLAAMVRQDFTYDTAMSRALARLSESTSENNGDGSNVE